MAKTQAAADRYDLDRFSGGFQDLMPKRIEHLLLVSSLYESFVLEAEGLLPELISTAYVDLQLTHPPRVTRVPDPAEALEIIESQPVDMVLTMTGFRGMSLLEFAEAAKQIRPDLPVVVLAEEEREITRQPEIRTCRSIDQLFVWHGDARLMLAIIKLIEDRLNAEHDTRVGDVRVIILVENSVRFYSAYLPLIYTELLKLTQSLMAEGINLMHRLLRLRARPKILLAETFEDAWELYGKFKDNVLGVVSDIRFPRDGSLDGEAGLEFTRRIRREAPYLPVLLQSSDPSFAAAAAEVGACFLNKQSHGLLQDLRNFILSNLGFGDFVFKLPNGAEVGRAHDLRSLEDALHHVPDASLDFHAGHHHFSNWLMARTEFELAARLRAKTVADFENIQKVRAYLIQMLGEFRARSQTGVITDFEPGRFDVATHFARIGGGSIGGKARGLAFINALIGRHNLRDGFPGVRIAVPRSAVVGTDLYDAFLDQNHLRGLASGEYTDEQIVRSFLDAEFPARVLEDLTAFLRLVRYPLAVRSSSLLEDSQDRPFAGVYATHMIPNNHPDLAVRRDQVCDAIKLVYASAFFRSAHRYLEATGRHSEEEKMGVILQELVGSQHGDRFYPTFSGVARSYNFYPSSQMVPADGVASVALGLGKTVVEGGESLMFSPAHPQVLPQFPTIADWLAGSQRKFYALCMDRPEVYPSADGNAHLVHLELDAAEEDGTLAFVGSVYSPENDVIYDGIHRTGLRLVTFAHILRTELFPLADILKLLLDIGREGMACPVEIEFAVDMSSKPMTFGFLQIRPIITREEFADVDLEHVDAAGAVCYSPDALGNGRICDVCDIVYVKPDTFNTSHTPRIAEELARVNEALRKEDRLCLLIGPGRWGSSNNWLGIPVTWDQVSTARVIVETTLQDFVITPSQGTHFFQNLTSLGIGYLTVDHTVNKGFVDWDWLRGCPPVRETDHVRWVRVGEPLDIRIDGRSQCGVVLKTPAGDGGGGKRKQPLRAVAVTACPDTRPAP